MNSVEAKLASFSDFAAFWSDSSFVAEEAQLCCLILLYSYVVARDNIHMTPPYGPNVCSRH